MLEELVVENLVLVRSARLSLHPGLNVLTGETGAGKTILAEAVGLLLGGRADASLVGPAGVRGLRRGDVLGRRAARGAVRARARGRRGRRRSRAASAARAARARCSTAAAARATTSSASASR